MLFRSWDGEFEHVRKKMKERMKWMDDQLGFTEPANPVVFEPIIHEPDWKTEQEEKAKEKEQKKNPEFSRLNDLSRLSPTNFFVVNGNQLEVQTDIGGAFAIIDLNGAVLYKTQIKTGITTVEIPAKARNTYWIATLNGKMMNR